MGIKVYVFDKNFFNEDAYPDDYLNTRIAYWEALGEDGDFGVLRYMYAERDRRVDAQLLAWVESK